MIYKNNKSKIAAVATAVVIFNFASCKYEEGPKFTLKGKASRLAGDWTKTDVSDEDLKDADVDVTFDKDNNFKFTTSFTFGGTTYDYVAEGVWEWANDKEGVRMIEQRNGNNIDTVDVTIKRLTSKELIFVDDEENTRYTFAQ